ncbi:MAG: hypothetical protein GKR88_00325 [Flavobacteriaceae bacterium]|nr:MAG: hypothetical protein GKR88_00325 [Flavobacteriaceae bacterium]
MKAKLTFSKYLGVLILLLFFSCKENDTISVTPPDQNSVIVANSELATLILDVSTNAIDCIDFNYPILFNVYNIDFQSLVNETVTNDAELRVMVTNRINTDTYLVSLHFPVNTNSGNTTFTLTSNEELRANLSTVSQQCQSTFDCPALQLNIGDPCIIQNQQGTVNPDCDCEI